MDISKTAEQFKKARNRLHRINYICIIQLYKINKEYILCDYCNGEANLFGSHDFVCSDKGTNDVKSMMNVVGNFRTKSMNILQKELFRALSAL